VKSIATFGVLDVDGVEPLLDMVQQRHRDGGDHHDLLGVVLGDEAHVEVLQVELDALEVDQLHVFQSDDQWRLKREDTLKKVLKRPSLSSF
jgi:hypothetical protein